MVEKTKARHKEAGGYVRGAVCGLSMAWNKEIVLRARWCDVTCKNCLRSRPKR